MHLKWCCEEPPASLPAVLPGLLSCSCHLTTSSDKSSCKERKGTDGLLESLIMGQHSLKAAVAPPRLRTWGITGDIMGGGWQSLPSCDRTRRSLLSPKGGCNPTLKTTVLGVESTTCRSWYHGQCTNVLMCSWFQSQSLSASEHQLNLAFSSFDRNALHLATVYARQTWVSSNK